MRKSRSGAAQARKPAATRRDRERGAASFGAVARARSAPERAWVSVSRTVFLSARWSHDVKKPTSISQELVKACEDPTMPHHTAGWPV
jgi:hypothetical protein